VGDKKKDRQRKKKQTKREDQNGKIGDSETNPQSSGGGGEDFINGDVIKRKNESRTSTNPSKRQRKTLEGKWPRQRTWWKENKGKEKKKKEKKKVQSQKHFAKGIASWCRTVVENPMKKTKEKEHTNRFPPKTRRKLMGKRTGASLAAVIAIFTMEREQVESCPFVATVPRSRRFGTSMNEENNGTT